MSLLRGAKLMVKIKRFNVSYEDKHCYLTLYKYKYETYCNASQVSYLD
jgi:hypothetical protein